jgi:predicted RNA binding protein YcfA (HicA-like mRNA interferase family)
MKLRPARVREVQRVLERLGFRLVRQKGSHAVYKHPDEGRLPLLLGA